MRGGKACHGPNIVAAAEVAATSVVELLAMASGTARCTARWG